MSHLIQNVNFLAVQWYSSQEWRKVFNLIFEHEGDISSRKEALQILLVWKARCPALPSAIESTLGLLEVELQDAIDNINSDVNNRLLRLMYSSVIMRFINHTLDDSQSKRLSLLQAATEMQIPQWIVNLRHETAHGHDLPSLSLLQNASEIALNWLYMVYWSPHNARISDVLTKENLLRSQFENELSEMISLHNLLAVLSHPSFNIIKLSDIGDIEMKESILSDFKTKKFDANTNIFPNMKIKTAVRCVVKNIKKLLINSNNRSCQKDEIFAKIMVGSDSLFLTSNHEITGDLNKQNKFSKEFTHLWEPLLILLHSLDMISALVRELIGIVENNEESQQRRLRSAQWVSEIAVALLKSKLIMNLPLPLHKNGISKKQHLFCILLDRYPNQKHGLTFSLSHPVPQNISNPEFTNQLFENYTPYLNIYLSQMLQLREPALPDATMHKSLELIRIMSSKTINVTCERIYTLCDLKNDLDLSIKQKETKSTGKISENTMDVDHILDPGVVDSHIGLGKWHRASAEFDWGKCPIGILPWQMNDFTNNTLLP